MSFQTPTIQSQPIICGATGIFGGANTFIVHASNITPDTVLLDVSPQFGPATSAGGTTVTLIPALSPPFRPSLAVTYPAAVYNNGAWVGAGIFSVDTFGNMVYTYPAAATGTCIVGSISVRYAGQ